MSSECAGYNLWEELSEKEKNLLEYQDTLESLAQEKKELEEKKPKTKLVVKIVCDSGKGTRWYDYFVGKEFEFEDGLWSSFKSTDYVLVRTNYCMTIGILPPHLRERMRNVMSVDKCDCIVYEKEIESVKEQKKDSTNKTYFEKQVELYLKDLGGNPFSTLSIRGVSNCLDSLMRNHNVHFESKIVKIQSPESFGCPFKVFVKGMSEEQISFLQKLIMYSLTTREIVEVVEFVEHPFSITPMEVVQ